MKSLEVKTELFIMSSKELSRLDYIKMFLEKRATQKEISKNLGISVRQVQRLVRAYKNNNHKGIISKKRGKISNSEPPRGLPRGGSLSILSHFILRYLSSFLVPLLTSKAIQYAFNNKDALMRFLDDGKIEIDNNAAERALRVVAIGRKNWTFAGSDQGGESAAVLYTILETAKLNGVNPWQYLTEVLDVIQDYNFKKLEDLLPWNLVLGKKN